MSSDFLSLEESQTFQEVDEVDEVDEDDKYREDDDQEDNDVICQGCKLYFYITRYEKHIYKCIYYQKYIKANNYKMLHFIKKVDEEYNPINENPPKLNESFNTDPNHNFVIENLQLNCIPDNKIFTII